MSEQRYRNPFNPAVVSDERWRRYVERYIAERGGDDDEPIEQDETDTQT